MKQLFFAVAIVALAFSPVYACSSSHADATAATLNQIFGEHVADGHDSANGEGAISLDYGGAHLDYDGAFWADAQPLIQWLLDHGAQVKPDGGSGVKDKNDHYNG